MFYFVKTPWLLRKIYPSYIWRIDTREKNLYLTFDDGPHPEITSFVLDELKKYNAKATFFCIGKNVSLYPEVMQRILREGHRIGNHTNTHLNGWQTSSEIYFNDINEAAKKIDSELFRPPYGRIRSSQAKKLESCTNGKIKKIVMWDVLSGDFDTTINANQCYNNVVGKTRKGSVIVFHDSEKAFARLRVALPQSLAFFHENNFKFETL